MLFYSPRKAVISMPPYTQTMGIWFNPDLTEKSYASDLYRKQMISEDFISRLPKHRFFSQNFRYTDTDWLPFYWSGFRQTTRYTYILPDIEDTDALWNYVNKSIRKNVLKAREKHGLQVQRGMDPSEFLNLNKKVYQRQRMKPYHLDVLQRLINESKSRGQGDIWAAYDVEGRLNAAVFMVWQESCAYCLASGSDPELRQSKGETLLLWEIICELSKQCASFDFEGSMIKGVENFHREFGAVQMPYFTITKGSRPWLRASIKRLCNFFKIHLM
jgi:lipid II:glycine glycyltransferase (peptidoglycan interpeptide bridge formation enzyme)